MEPVNLKENRLKKFNVCVIVPTYNNAATLMGVLDELLTYTEDIIVVNDGSSDNTDEILKKYSGLEIISYEKNKGKGYALKNGFSLAKEKGFQYAITIDSDGQHIVGDILSFIDKLEKEPDSLIIGNRNMDKDGIPKKSSFGRKFSNFWFWVETGIKHPDTQSGFRLYPLKHIDPDKFYTKKFEFEIEIIVRLAWKGVNVTSVPIEVVYQKQDERVTHFRPFVDFTRMSILNTVLVFWALLYIKPRDIARKALSKSWKEHYYEQIANPKFSNLNLAMSIGFGVFMGIVPIWGYQMVTAVFLAYLLRLNKVLVIIASNISIPPLTPIIIYLSLKAGEIITGNDLNLNFSSDISFQMVKSVLYTYIVGSLIFAALAGVLSGAISLLILTITRKAK